MKQILHMEVVPHQEQLYDTVGNWQFFQGAWPLCVTVSDLGDWRMEACVGIHEAVEALICKHRGISDVAVTVFDESYEQARTGDEDAKLAMMNFGCGCEITAESEPGDDIHAPYYREHQMATAVERMLAVELDLSWNEYEGRILAQEF